MLKWTAMCFAALLAAPVAHATTLLKLDVPGLTRLSDVVVRASVEGVEAKWSGDKRRIYTEAKLKVTEVLKGNLEVGATAIATQPGGEVGDVGQRVHGVARFTPGQDIVIFLERRGPLFTVTGMVQGKFNLSEGVATAEVEGAHLVDPLSKAPVQAAKVSYAYAELKALVQRSVGTIEPEPKAPTTPTPSVPVKP